MVIQIPGYSIVQTLGQGGMATVYLAVQQSLGREVALKVLAPALAQNKVATERFVREAHIAARLHHPNIVAVHDVGVHAGIPYMAMAFEPAGTIAAVAPGARDSNSALRAVRDIACALDYAHQQGVVHRDIKPENILIRGDGAAVLTDFGIARTAEIASGLTAEGCSVGTPHYMSPEQWRGEPVDGRSDLYSLGVVFFQLLCGHLPYQGTDGWAVGMQHMSAQIPRLPVECVRWQPLLDDLLAKDAGARPQTGAEVVRRIDALLNAPTVLLAAPMATTVNNTVLAHSPRRRGRFVVAIVAVVAAVAALWWQPWRIAPTSTAVVVAPAPAVASIAVLPFVDMSENKDQDYFSDGLSEELLDRLTKLPQLQVAGRTSSFSFKGKNDDLRSIGQKLGVTTVLEGSVRKAGNRLRITAQLINVADGFHVWSQSYDRELTDVFALQDEIAAAVVDALRIKLLPSQQSPAKQAYVPTPEAYDLFLLGRQSLRNDAPASRVRAVQAFAHAVELDPNYASAYTGLAMAELFVSYSVQSEAEALAGRERARIAAERAITLDPTLSDAYATRGFLRFSADWDWLGAQQDFEKALELDPADVLTLLRYGVLLAHLGRLPEAIAVEQQATEIDPMFVPPWDVLARCYVATGDYDNARRMVKRSQAIAPDNSYPENLLRTIAFLEGDFAAVLESYRQRPHPVFRLFGIALVEHELGHAEAAQQASQTLIRDHADTAAYQIAVIHSRRGEMDLAFQWLDRAYAQRDGGLTAIQLDPLIAELRKDARYPRFLRKMGFPP